MSWDSNSVSLHLPEIAEEEGRTYEQWLNNFNRCSTANVAKHLRTPILKNIWKWLLWSLSLISGSSCSEKFTRKYLCLSNTIKKRYSRVLSCEVCQIFKNTVYYTELLHATASQTQKKFTAYTLSTILSQPWKIWDRLYI